MTSIENEITEVAEGKYGSFAQREPAILTGLVAGPVTGVLAFLAERGVITDADAGTLASVLVGAVVALIIAGQSLLIRRFVVPAWKHYTTRPRPNLGVGPVTDTAPEQGAHHPMPGAGKHEATP